MNRQIRIFSTKDDEYLKDFKEVALELNLKILIYHYERFSFADNRLTYTGRKDFPKFSDQDSVLFRRPSYDKQKQHFWVRLLATLARDAGSKVINPDFMVNFPLHSGKLFQAAYFSAYDIPHVPTYRLDRKLKNLDFPMIIKKRYSAYGHGTCLVESNAEFNEARSRIAGKGDYIVQKFYPLKRDVRVMVLNNQVIGSVQRQPHIHADRRVGVKVGRPIELIEAEQDIVKQVIRVFDLDLAGLDLFTNHQGKTWLGEMNFFPNFTSFMRETEINLFKLILENLNRH